MKNQEQIESALAGVKRGARDAFEALLRFIGGAGTGPTWQRKALVEAVMEGLLDWAESNPEDVLEIVDLLDAIRRERVTSFVDPTHADQIVQELTGTSNYPEYDAWKLEKEGKAPAVVSFVWHAGDSLVLDGVGVVQFGQTKRATVIVLEGESPIELPIERAAHRLRKPISAAEAEGLLERFGTFGGESLPDRPYGRKKVYEAAMKTNDPVQVASALERLYRYPDPKHPEDRYASKLERVLFGEIAFVLDRRIGDLIRRARKSTGGRLVLEDRSQDLAEAGDVPELKGAEIGGAFATDGELLVGESSVYRVESSAAVWFAWELYGELEFLAEVLCVRSDYTEHLSRLRQGAREVWGHFAIDGASARLFDASLEQDPEFWPHLEAGVIEIPAFGPRGFQAYTGGDGAGELFAAAVDASGDLVEVLFEPTPGDLGQIGVVSAPLGEIVYLSLRLG